MFKMLRKLLCRCNHSIKFTCAYGSQVIGQCEKCGRHWLHHKETDTLYRISAAKAREIEKQAMRYFFPTKEH